MSLLERIRLLLRLHKLINRKATGTPDECAARLNISRAALYRYIKDLKAVGAPVIYCEQRLSFVYSCDFNLDFNKV